MKTKILKISAVILSVVIILSMFTSCNDVIRGAWEIYGLVFNELEDAVGARMLYAKTDIDIIGEYCEHIKKSEF